MKSDAQIVSSTVVNTLNSWHKSKLKYIAKLISGSGFPKEYQGNAKGDFAFLKVSDINGYGSAVHTSKNYVPGSLVVEKKWKIIPANSIVLPKIGAALLKNHRKITRVDSIIDNNLVALKPYDGTNEVFLFYLMSTINLDYFLLPGAIPSASISQLAELEVILPSEHHQRKIAAFLDERTSLIETLVRNNKKLIKLLEEKRAAVINQAVTKGLDPDVIMKDSGVEWIGKIPEHWEVKRLRYFVSRRDQKASEDLARVALENIVSKRGKFTSGALKYEGPGIKFEKGDVLFGKLRPYLAKVWCSEFDGIAVGDFYVMKPNTNLILPEYFAIFLLNPSTVNYINSMTFGAKMPRVDWNTMANLLVPCPSISEQRKILSSVFNWYTKIDTLIDAIRRQSTLLEEYKSSLINHLVTGKFSLDKISNS